jgi:hypothetical protein
MPYVNPQDIREHVKGIGSVGVPQISELMTEVETYVKMRLNMSTLPENNDIVKDIVRELTISKVILDTLQPNAEDLGRADMHRRNGRQLLQEAITDGLVPGSLSPANRDITKELYNPYPEPFFTREEFTP